MGDTFLREAGEPLGYLLLDFTLNLSQACFNSREVQQKWTRASSGSFVHSTLWVSTPLYRCCTLTVLHQLPANLLQPAASWFTSNNKEWTKCPIIKDQNHFMERFLSHSTSPLTKGESGGWCRPTLRCREILFNTDKTVSNTLDQPITEGQPKIPGFMPLLYVFRLSVRQ